ncbi:rhodanese-like domain-containing protein [Actinotalea sp. M2MS4P-6]|uniref:rhodanese-like domain-containing protein n=1 Tax=Actinotalea sp. M2MS4P-6 TaxID=2983762 RepID=UPI0021E3BA04|nr:rhodanese-like domain-containing protein [Actinotalea sp. M2MS4P-6]MCV2396311.1 rhodanese-like domain-containing protein [Actinotalea sp. M2MS4P-6]
MTQRSRLLRGVAAAAFGVAIAVSAAGCSSSAEGTSQSTSAATLSVVDFAKRVATDGVVTIDVRTPEEYASGHLPGAINIDVEAADFADQVAKLDHTAPYALYCRTGNRSGMAMGIMADEGFTDLAHLDGGITDWAQQGGTIVTN